MDWSLDSDIDAAILATTQPSWRKVAFIIARVDKKVGSKMPAGEAALNLIAERIESLVKSGLLLAKGNLKEWRYSEIRKPN